MVFFQPDYIGALPLPKPVHSPRACGESEDSKGGSAIGFLFPRWQELKRKGGKKRRIVQITEEILKDFSSMCT